MDTTLGFHVETPRCANPECRRSRNPEPMREARGAAPRTGAGRPPERSFCSGCWSRLRVGTRKRIVASHAHRAGRLHTVRMAISELKSKSKATNPTHSTTHRTNGGLR